MSYGYDLEDDLYNDPYGIAKIHDDMLDKGIIDDSGTYIKSDREILDDIDITVIENYIREKKLLKIIKKKGK